MIFKHDLPRWGIAVLFFLSLFFAFSQPELVREAIQNGFSLCTGPLLSSLFPFLVLSNLLFVCNTHSYLGRFFCLPAKLMGIRNPCAGTPVLMGYTGGFASAAVTLRNLYTGGSLSAQECTALLPLCLCPSPSFVVVTVGMFFHNRHLGWILYLAQVVACFSCGLLYRFLHRTDKAETSVQVAQAPVTTSPSFSDAIASATLSYVKLCGCILFFSFLSACFTHCLPQPFCEIVPLCMEISSGCLRAAQIAPNGIYLCSCIISLLGFSALLQLRALLPKEISLKPFLLLRPVHMLLSVLVTRLLMHFLPASDVYNSLAPDILLRNRVSAIHAILLFILLCRLAALFSKLTDWKSNHSVV